MQLEPSTTNAPTLIPTGTKVDRFLLSTPELIKLLAGLIVMSRTATFDMSLQDVAPFATGFKYILDPSSLNACLLQLSYNVSSTLLRIHTNLDQVQKNIKYLQPTNAAVLNIFNTAPFQLIPMLGKSELKALDVICSQMWNIRNELNNSMFDIELMVFEIFETIIHKVGKLRSDCMRKANLTQNAIEITKLNLELVEKTLNTTQMEFNDDVEDYKKEFEATVST